jgi:hypothetical protein
VLFFDSDADDVWLENVFDQHVEPPALRAFDTQPVKGGKDAVVDLTAAIKKGNVTGYPEGVWVKSFSVEDLSGNAVEFHIKYKVVTITADVLLPLLAAIADTSDVQKMADVAAAAAAAAAAPRESATPGVPSVCAPAAAPAAPNAAAHESTWALLGLVLLWLLLSTVVLSTASKVLAALQVTPHASALVAD